MKIKKAVIPIAGKGTRFLPATKQIAKEIIPIINVPMIHHVVTEAVEAGIEQIIFVTSSGKFSIEDYFDRNQELEAFLKAKNKTKELELIKQIGSMVSVTSVRQKEQLGLGHAVLCAKELVGDENFAVLLGDDIIIGPTPATKQLIEQSAKNDHAPVIGVMEVPREETFRYGVIQGEKIEGRMNLLKSMVEKPKPELAPSTLATPGRYILPKEIFSILEEIPRGAGNEYQLTDALNLLAQRRTVYAYEFEGERFDTGNIRGYLEATIDFGLRDESTREDLIKIIQERFKKYGIKL